MVRKQAPKIWDVVMVFAGLSVVFIVLAVLAQWLFTGNGFMYTILISLGAAIFGAGLAFFLLEVSEIQRARMVLASRVSIFVAAARTRRPPSAATCSAIAFVNRCGSSV